MSEPSKERVLENLNLSGIMGTYSGRCYVRRILMFTGVYRDTFSKDPSEQSRMAGRRQVGLSIIADIKEACPELYVQMTKERIDDE